MIGLPRSGKSTKARELGFPIVNLDSIRLSLHGQAFLPEAEPWVHLIAKTMVKALFFAGHTHVILDSTNISREHRDEWKSPKWNREYIHIDTDVKTCIGRARMEGNTTLVAVIRAMDAKYLSVRKAEGMKKR